jgi:hypothetical protein
MMVVLEDVDSDLAVVEDVAPGCVVDEDDEASATEEEDAASLIFNFRPILMSEHR